MNNNKNKYDDLISEDDAYKLYVKKCHSEVGNYVSEFNFMEWRAMGRPKSQYVKDGYWGKLI